jgi:hypothetical protein
MNKGLTTINSFSITVDLVTGQKRLADNTRYGSVISPQRPTECYQCTYYKRHESKCRQFGYTTQGHLPACKQGIKIKPLEVIQ